MIIAYHEKNHPNMDDYRWSKIIHFWNRTIPPNTSKLRVECKCYLMLICRTQLSNQTCMTYSRDTRKERANWLIREDLLTHVHTIIHTELLTVFWCLLFGSSGRCSGRTHSHRLGRGSYKRLGRQLVAPLTQETLTLHQKWHTHQKKKTLRTATAEEASAFLNATHRRSVHVTCYGRACTLRNIHEHSSPFTYMSCAVGDFG